jgi:hypothetical protein
MIGAIRGFFATAALTLLTSAALAATPSIATVDNTAANTFLSDLDSMITRQRGDSNLHLANVRNGTSDVIWFDPLKDRGNAFGFNRIMQQDAEWMRSNVRLYEIYEQFDGNAIGKEQQFRVGGAGYYVGLDGFGGRWFPSNGEAQGYLFKLLISSSSELLPAVKTAVANVTSNDLGTVLQVARDAMAANRVFVARGSNNTLIIRGANFGSGGIAPKVVFGSSGVTAGAITYDSTEQITVPVVIAGDAPLGDRVVLLFNAGNALTPIVEFRLTVVRGSGTPVPQADDHAATLAGATLLTIGTAQAGRIDGTTDADLFRIVATAGTLTLESVGTTDLIGELLDGSGALIAGNDDGGTWHNFSIQQAVGAGTYYLRVRHCCEGGGSYVISSTLQ